MSSSGHATSSSQTLSRGAVLYLALIPGFGFIYSKSAGFSAAREVQAIEERDLRFRAEYGTDLGVHDNVYLTIDVDESQRLNGLIGDFRYFNTATAQVDHVESIRLACSPSTT